MSNELAGEQISPVAVWVAAQSVITRAGLESLVRSDKRFQIAGSSSGDINNFLLASPLSPLDWQPDVVLFDVANANEINLLSKHLNTTEEVNRPIVLLLAPELQTRQLLRKILVGKTVRGVLARDVSGEEITAAIIAAAENLFVIAPEILELLTNQNEQIDLSLPPTKNDLKNPLSLDFPLDTLTAREQEILELLAEGAGNKQIANRLNISNHTVKFHVASIFAKLAVSTRTEAVTEGLRRGLILL